MCTGLPVKTRFLIVGHFYLSFKDNFWKVECCSREDSGHGEFWLVLVTERRSTGRGKGFPVSGHSRGWGPYRQREPLIPTRRCPTRRWRLPASPVLTLLFCLGLSRGATCVWDSKAGPGSASDSRSSPVRYSQSRDRREHVHRAGPAGGGGTARHGTRAPWRWLPTETSGCTCASPSRCLTRTQKTRANDRGAGRAVAPPPSAPRC